MRVNCPRCLGYAAIILAKGRPVSVEIPPDTIAQCAFRRQHDGATEPCPHLKRALQADVRHVARVPLAGAPSASARQGE